mmetsp:Transcript_7697/g.19737  ORF Transcript_7697/g.19737 Transcript_7697/m.19737 type:complete len:535 (-) Transcript_7697:1736-3340(-)
MDAAFTLDDDDEQEQEQPMVHERRRAHAFAPSLSGAVGIRHFFVLDTSWRTLVEDQCLAVVKRGDGSEAARCRRCSRVDCQVAAMKTICCLEGPECVGVVLMGSTLENVRMDLDPTKGWRRGGGGQQSSALATYVIDHREAEPPSLDDEASAQAQRLPLALHLCIKKLEELKLNDADLPPDKQILGNITVFLCSPPFGMADIGDRMDELKDALEAVETDVNFILHPDAYPASFHESLKGIWSEMGGQQHYATPQFTCTEEDLHALEYLCGDRFAWQVHTQTFVGTLLNYAEHFFGWDVEVKKTLLPQWEWCYGIAGAPLLLPKDSVQCVCTCEPLATMIVKVRMKEGVSLQEFKDFFFSQSHQRTMVCDETRTTFAPLLGEKEAVIMFVDVHHAVFMRGLESCKESLEPFLASLQVYRCEFLGERKGDHWESVISLGGFELEPPRPEPPGIFFKVKLREGVDADSWMALFSFHDEDRKTWCDDSKTVIAKINERELCVMIWGTIKLDKMNKLFQEHYENVNACCHSHIIYSFKV